MAAVDTPPPPRPTSGGWVGGWGGGRFGVKGGGSLGFCVGCFGFFGFFLDFIGFLGFDNGRSQVDRWGPHQ